MAIPGWLWPDSTAGTESTASPSDGLEASEIENATSAFEVLSHPIRLEILASLYSRSDAISYTRLRESTSVDDNGQFNYHLRQLELLVRNQGDEYTLTERGEELIAGVLSGEQIRQYESASD